MAAVWQHKWLRDSQVNAAGVILKVGGDGVFDPQPEGDSLAIIRVNPHCHLVKLSKPEPARARAPEPKPAKKAVVSPPIPTPVKRVVVSPPIPEPVKAPAEKAPAKKKKGSTRRRAVPTKNKTTSK